MSGSRPVLKIPTFEHERLSDTSNIQAPKALGLWAFILVSPVP